MKTKIIAFLNKHLNENVEIVKISNQVVKLRVIKRRLFRKNIIVDEIQIPLHDNPRDTLFSSYIAYCKETFSVNCNGNKHVDIQYLCLGMSEELGELIGSIKKVMFHGKDNIRHKVLMESGDLMWYFINLMGIMDINPYDMFDANIIKLENRFPNGNTNVKFNRDIISEDNIIRNQYGDSNNKNGS